MSQERWKKERHRALYLPTITLVRAQHPAWAIVSATIHSFSADEKKDFSLLPSPEPSILDSIKMRQSVRNGGRGSTISFPQMTPYKPHHFCSTIALNHRTQMRTSTHMHLPDLDTRQSYTLTSLQLSYIKSRGSSWDSSSSKQTN